MVEFSVVLPLRNEVEMLPITLGSILRLKPDELLIGLDRCSDNTERVLLQLLTKHATTSLHSFLVKKYTEEDGQEWAFRGAYLRRDLYKHARNDTILNTSGDLYIGEDVFPWLREIPRYGLVSFGYWDQPWNYQSFMRRLISDHSPIHGFAGLLAFSKQAWMQSEDLEELKKAKRAEDTHLHIAIRRIKPTHHVNTRSLHLRPHEDARSHYNRGVAQWEMLHNPPWKPFLHSVAMLRPAVFTGYMHARSRHD